jgi:predicted GNAT superfamily acetyltransferase
MRPLERTIVVQGRRYLLRVEQSHDATDYQKYEDIRNDVWGYPEDHLAGTRNMMCENFLAEGGSLFIGAFAEGPGGTFSTDGASLVGFCYGFAGILDKELGFRDPANFRFYAQYAGVRREALHRGLGIPMKEFQREIVRDVFGIGTTICTYDPLTGVNAHRNVHHFGMSVLEYRVATYGEYGGFLNRLDVPTDRFLMSWDLSMPAREPGAADAGLNAPRWEWKGRGRPRGGPGGRPERGSDASRPDPRRLLHDAARDRYGRRRYPPHPRGLAASYAPGFHGPLRARLPGRRFPQGRAGPRRQLLRPRPAVNISEQEPRICLNPPVIAKENI